MIEIAVDMGVQVINTELSGTPDEPEFVKRWYRSMEELLPIVERDSNRNSVSPTGFSANAER